MNHEENRRFPRIPHVTSRQIVRLDSSQNPQRNIIFTKNLSACGIKFSTNENLNTASYFLIYLNDIVLKELHQNGENLLKSGNFFLAQVVWSRQVEKFHYEIGASFLEKQTCQSQEFETFTELVNVSMLDSLPEASKPNLTAERQS